MKLCRMIAVAALAATAMPAFAQSTPPAGSLPLSTILTTVENGGARTVYSADFDDGNWEIVSCEGRNRICREDYINPATGAVIRSGREGVERLPPRDALPASTIVSQVEALNLGPIIELDFDDRRWDVEIAGQRGRTELKIDPMTGAINRCDGRGCP